MTQRGGQPFLKINSRIVFENLVKTRARLLNRSLQVVELTPLLASQCQAQNKKHRQNRLSCQKAVSSLSGARYFSRWCPISWPLPGSPWWSHQHKSEGWDRDYFRRVKSENGLSDCQLRVLSSHLLSSQTIFSKLWILWILIWWRQQPASVATLAFLTQVVFEYGNCQELPGLEPIHFCGSAAIIEMLRLLTPQRMTQDEDLSVHGAEDIDTGGQPGQVTPGVVGSWRDVNTWSQPPDMASEWGGSV